MSTQSLYVPNLRQHGRQPGLIHRLHEVVMESGGEQSIPVLLLPAAGEHDQSLAANASGMRVRSHPSPLNEPVGGDPTARGTGRAVPLI